MTRWTNEPGDDKYNCKNGDSEGEIDDKIVILNKPQ